MFCSWVGMNSAVASIWMWTKLSYLSFGVLQISPEEHSICFLVLLYICW